MPKVIYEKPFRGEVWAMGEVEEDKCCPPEDRLRCTVGHIWNFPKNLQVLRPGKDKRPLLLWTFCQNWRKDITYFFWHRISTFCSQNNTNSCTHVMHTFLTFKTWPEKRHIMNCLSLLAVLPFIPFTMLAKSPPSLLFSEFENFHEMMPAKF